MVDAIRAGARLRDKVIVVSIEAPQALREAPLATADPEHIDAVAADLALLRAFGAKALVVAAAGVGPAPLDAQGPALRLHAALARHEERGVLLPATGLVTVQRIPAAGRAPVTPSMIPIVNGTLLIYLLALKYVPLVYAPAVDSAGAAVELGTGTLAAFLAQAAGAALVLVAPSSVAEASQALREASLASAAAAGLPPIVPTEPGPGRLISDILRYAPNLPITAAPATAPSATVPPTAPAR
jgi:hypothetical protein